MNALCKFNFSHVSSEKYHFQLLRSAYRFFRILAFCYQSNILEPRKRKPHKNSHSVQGINLFAHYDTFRLGINNTSFDT